LEIQISDEDQNRFGLRPNAFVPSFRFKGFRLQINSAFQISVKNQ
jgi:hypothetical protein